MAGNAVVCCRYVIGGYYYGSESGCRSDVARITAAGGSWQSRAAFPRGIHRQCGVADSGHDRLYVLGGHDCHHSRAEVYYYQVNLTLVRSNEYSSFYR